MIKWIFFALSGVLALFALNPEFVMFTAVGAGAVLGPAGFVLTYPLFYLPAIWLALASFALIHALLKRWIAAALPRELISGAGVALLGFAVFVAVPAAQSAHLANRAAQILATDIAPPQAFPLPRSVELRLEGVPSVAAPLLGPGGCFDLCVDMLAAGVLDRVILRSDKDARVISRETTASGCQSNLFSRNQQGREFRLQLAGICLTSTPLEGPPTGFEADITLVMKNDWQDPRFQMRQVQVFDRTGKMLMQRSQLAWQDPNPQLRGVHFPGQSGPNPQRHQAGSPLAPFGWPQIARLLGLPQTGLADSALALPAGTDPATIAPPDVSFRMLELLAQKGALTASERQIFVAMMLQPDFRASSQTPAALVQVLASAPQYGRPIAAALEQRALALIARGEIIFDPELPQTLQGLRNTLPVADLPPVLAQLRPEQLAPGRAFSQTFAIAAADLGAPPAQTLAPVLAQAEREAVNFVSPASHPYVVEVSAQALNGAICRHAAALRPNAGLWLSWASHHAADVPSDRDFATALGLTAAHLGLPPGDVTAAFAQTAGWDGAPLAALAQPASLPCPG